MLKLPGKTLIDHLNRQGGNNHGKHDAQRPNRRLHQHARTDERANQDTEHDGHRQARIDVAALQVDARAGCRRDADASATVDALLPLWFALVRHNGGNRRVALRITR